jgi:hypothetical protein
MLGRGKQIDSATERMAAFGRAREQVSYFGQHDSHDCRIDVAGLKDLGAPRIGPRFIIEAAAAPAKARDALKVSIIQKVSEFVGKSRGEFLIAEGFDEPTVYVQVAIRPTECADRFRSQHVYADV